MKLPTFSEFLSNIDHEKLEYDLSMFSSGALKEPSNPFTKEEYTLLVSTNLAMMKALLSTYHQWLSEQIQVQDPEK